MVRLPTAAAFAQGANGPAISARIEQTAKTFITRNALEAPIRFLASDALEGRGPGTRGDQLARLYLATELEGLGYQPGLPERTVAAAVRHRRHQGGDAAHLELPGASWPRGSEMAR